jgi:DNA-3-methyladenine glycosylase
MPRAPRSFFATTSERLAPRLLGCTLVRVLNGERLAGVIVEVEAYAGVKDTASHAFNGRRGPKNEAMYAQAGTSYVYFTYGMHFCMNIVCGGVDQPLAVLIRALEPVEGIDRMRAHRTGAQKKPLRDRDLCSGPGKLCQALRITRDQNHLDLTTSKGLFLELPTAPVPRSRMVRTTRVGIGDGHAWAQRPLRWLLKDNAHVSVPVR